MRVRVGVGARVCVHVYQSSRALRAASHGVKQTLVASFLPTFFPLMVDVVAPTQLELLHQHPSMQTVSFPFNWTTELIATLCVTKSNIVNA